MCLPGVIVAAGSAYLFLTATFTTKMGLDLTASQRAEVTKRMLAVIQSRHNHFSTELSPKIKLSCPYERALQEKLTLQTSLLITRWGSSLSWTVADVALVSTAVKLGFRRSAKKSKLRECYPVCPLPS